MIRPKDLPGFCDLHCFRKGVRPTWGEPNQLFLLILYCSLPSPHHPSKYRITSSPYFLLTTAMYNYVLEDEENKYGGKWIVHLKKNSHEVSTKIWEEVVSGLVTMNVKSKTSNLSVLLWFSLGSCVLSVHSMNLIKHLSFLHLSVGPLEKTTNSVVLFFPWERLKISSAFGIKTQKTKMLVSEWGGVSLGVEK